jgi:hypothetical protein
VRSCSRAGKPTDNPACESLNGWIKEELFVDFGLYDVDDVPAAIDAYIEYYNSQRPCYSLGYLTPDEFYQRFMAGEIERKDTFKDRVLDETPKFVRQRKGKGSDGLTDSAAGAEDHDWRQLPAAMPCAPVHFCLPEFRNSISDVYEAFIKNSPRVHFP